MRLCAQRRKQENKGHSQIEQTHKNLINFLTGRHLSEGVFLLVFDGFQIDTICMKGYNNTNQCYIVKVYVQ